MHMVSLTNNTYNHHHHFSTQVNSIAQVAMLLKQGIANRVTSATTMNAHSSRSHAIFTIYLQVIYSDPLGHQHIRKAKLNLVDLAGSERHGRFTGVEWRLRESR